MPIKEGRGRGRLTGRAGSNREGSNKQDSPTQYIEITKKNRKGESNLFYNRTSLNIFFSISFLEI